MESTCQKEKIRILNPIIVTGVPNSGTSLVTGLLHLGGAWVGNTRCDLTIKKNPIGFFENCDLEKHIYYFRKRGENLRSSIEEEIICQGYRGGYWAYKAFPLKTKEWEENFKPFWVFTNRSIQAVYKSRFGKDWEDREPEKEEKLRGMFQDFYTARDRIISGTDRYFDITPSDMTQYRDFTELKKLYELTGLIYYPQLVDHFVVSDLWHNRDNGGDQ